MLDAVRQDLEDLPEIIAAEYEQQEDGTYRLSVQEVDGVGLDDVKGLKEVLADQKDKHQKKSEQLDTYRDDKGELIDISELGSLREQVAKLADSTPKEKVESLVAERLAEHHRKYKSDLAAKDQELTTLEKQLHNVVVEQAAIAAIGRAGASKHVDLLLPSVMGMIRSEMIDGKPTPVVVGENGTPRISLKTGSRDPMTVDELLDEMKSQEAYAPVFPGSGNSGSGAPPRTQGVERNGAVILTAEESRDPKKWQAARDQANERGVQVEVLEE